MEIQHREISPDLGVVMVRTIGQTVRSKLESEVAEAKSISDSIGALPGQKSQLSILDFFPVLKQKHGGRHTNQVKDKAIPLVHQLLYGDPLIVDIQPLNPIDFEQTHRLTIKSMERLAAGHRVFLNLYWRDPDKWMGADEMCGLVDKSFANGVRVDSYMARRAAGYDAAVRQRTDEVGDAFAELVARDTATAEELAKRHSSTLDTFAKVQGTRWAYLDAFNEKACAAHVRALTSSGRLAEAAEFLRLSKHRLVSPISAALGGQFTWRKSDLEAARVNSLGGIMEGPGVQVVERVPKEWLEFLLHTITESKPQASYEVTDQDKFVDFLLSKELTDLKQDLSKATSAMAALEPDSQSTQQTAAEWCRLRNELHRHIDVQGPRKGLAPKLANLTASTALGFAGGIILSSPFESGATSAAIALAAGGIAIGVAWGVEKQAERSKPLTMSRDEHRFLMAVDPYAIKKRTP